MVLLDNNPNLTELIYKNLLEYDKLGYDAIVTNYVMYDFVDNKICSDLNETYVIGRHILLGNTAFNKHLEKNYLINQFSKIILDELYHPTSILDFINIDSGRNIKDVNSQTDRSNSDFLLNAKYIATDIMLINGLLTNWYNNNIDFLNTNNIVIDGILSKNEVELFKPINPGNIYLNNSLEIEFFNDFINTFLDNKLKYDYDLYMYRDLFKKDIIFDKLSKDIFSYLNPDVLIKFRNVLLGLSI